MNYRKLTLQEAIERSKEILDYAHREPLRAFLDDFYGPGAYLVTVETESSKGDAWVSDILVWTPAGERVSPDPLLAGWKEIPLEAGEEPFALDGNLCKQDRVSAVNFYFVQKNVFLEYGIEVVEGRDERIEEGEVAEPAALYVLEGDLP
jgi:hypothetical protein